MSVLKNLRRLSNMEFYKNATKIRFEINRFIQTNFGVKHKLHNIKVFSKRITDVDKNRIYEILDPYDITDNKVFGLTVDDWFYDSERDDLRKYAKELVHNIIKANEVYVYCDMEYERRRCLQDDAIVNCYELYDQLQFMESFIPIDINKELTILELLDLEIDLLQGWKKSNHEAWQNKKRDTTVKATNACNANGNNGNANYNNASNTNFVRPRFNGSK